jgi:uncharacterized membrane protein
MAATTDSPDKPKRLPPILRSKFVAGLLILVPIVITVKGLWWLFTYMDGLAGPVAVSVFGRPVPGVGFVTTIAVVFLTGVLFSSGPLRRLLDGAEDVLEIVPVVGSVYGTTKKVMSGFGGSDSQEAFKRFVFARLPGRITPGFVTGSFTLTRPDGSTQGFCTVYVPTNHLYVGDVVVVPECDVIETDLTLEDGVSLVLSAGASVPPALRQK